MDSVTVLVFGDLGRSPRMLNHAKALSDNSCQVSLIGLSGSELSNSFTTDSNINIHRILDNKRLGTKDGVTGIFRKGTRFIGLGISLFRLLKQEIGDNEILLVQNPPSLPTLALSVWFRATRNCRVVIDWHNYSYSILALRYGNGHPLVSIWYRIEKWLAKKADAHLCVSAAMQADLAERFNIENANVVYDRPLAVCPIDIETRKIRRNDFISKYAGLLEPEDSSALWICSPTSWTIDENFNLLINGFQDLENSECRHPVVFIITGKGDNKKAFENAVAQLNLKRCKVLTLWLPPEKYFPALQMMDLGLCLHTSSSGLDIPYKIPEMNGAGLPVLAYDYGLPLKETVIPEVNGELFSSEQELASYIDQLCDQDNLAAITDALLSSLSAKKSELWKNYWNENVWPILKEYE